MISNFQTTSEKDPVTIFSVNLVHSRRSTGHLNAAAAQWPFKNSRVAHLIKSFGKCCLPRKLETIILLFCLQSANFQLPFQCQRLSWVIVLNLIYQPVLLDGFIFIRWPGAPLQAHKTHENNYWVLYFKIQLQSVS